MSTKSVHGIHARRFVRATVSKMVDRTASEADFRILFVVLRDFISPESYIGKFLNACAHIKELDRDSSVPPVFHERMMDCSFIMGARSRDFVKLDKRFGYNVRQRYNSKYGFGTFECNYELDNDTGTWNLLEGKDPPIDAISSLYGSIEGRSMSRLEIRSDLNAAIEATQAGVDIAGAANDHVAQDLCVALAGSLHGMRMRCVLGQSMRFLINMQEPSPATVKRSVREAQQDMSEEELNDQFDERVVMTHYMRAIAAEHEVSDVKLARVQNLYLGLFNTGLTWSEMFSNETDLADLAGSDGAISHDTSFRMVRGPEGELRLAVDRSPD